MSHYRTRYQSPNPPLRRGEELPLSPDTLDEDEEVQESYVLDEKEDNEE